MSWRVALGVPLTVIVSVRVLGGGKVEMVWALTGNLDLRWRFWRVVYGGGKVVEGEGSGVCSIAVRVGEVVWGCRQWCLCLVDGILPMDRFRGSRFEGEL